MKNNTKSDQFLMEKVPKPLYRFLRDFHKCQGCGKCCHCSPIALMGDDIRVLACKLGMSVKDFKKMYTEHYPGSINLSHFKHEKPCTFLDENNRCKVYDARPKICRDYPLVKGLRIPKECEHLIELLKEVITPDGNITEQSIADAYKRRLVKVTEIK